MEELAGCINSIDLRKYRSIGGTVYGVGCFTLRGIVECLKSCMVYKVVVILYKVCIRAFGDYLIGREPSGDLSLYRLDSCHIGDLGAACGDLCIDRIGCGLGIRENFLSCNGCFKSCLVCTEYVGDVGIVHTFDPCGEEGVCGVDRIGIGELQELRFTESNDLLDQSAGCVGGCFLRRHSGCISNGILKVGVFGTDRRLYLGNVRGGGICID